MNYFLSFFIFFIFALFHTDVFADPTLQTLFTRSTATEDVTKAGLESGRFKSEKKIIPAEIKVVETNYVPIKKRKKMVIKKPASETTPAPVQICAPAVVTAEDKPETEVSYQEPLFKDQIKDLMQSGAPREIEKYKSQLHSDDIRLNRLEVEIGTGLSYNGAESNYSFRNYYTIAPTLRAGGHVWMTPLIGVTGRYETTFGENISANTTSSTYPTKTTWLEFSFDNRKFFGSTRKANSIQYGIILSQYKFDVQNSATSRVGLTTTGLGIYVNSRFPVAPSYAWTFGFEAFPVLSHSEQSTGFPMSSGGSNTSSRIGLSAGGEFKLNRSNQIIWTLGAKMEQDQYSGTATTLDPKNNSTPTGVSITNTWTYLHLGYRWGQ